MLLLGVAGSSASSTGIGSGNKLATIELGEAGEDAAGCGGVRAARDGAVLSTADQSSKSFLKNWIGAWAR